jgi:branched-chain amino acid transport system permease protein
MTQFINALVSGISLGGIYGLIALGFVIIYRSTHTLNFAQGTILTLGAYITYFLSGPIRGMAFDNPPSLLRLPYWLAIIVAMVIMGVFGWLLEVLVIRRFRGRPVFAIIMATLGVGTVLGGMMTIVWGTSPVNLQTPFGSDFSKIGDVSLSHIDIATLIIVAVIAVAFFFGFQRSKLGTAMKATAFDQEAAIAQGISPKVIFGASWALSCALATLAGVLLASGAGSVATQVSPGLELFTLVGFPAIVLGGVDSLEGAVVGGMVIGIVQALSANYEAKEFHIFGIEFSFEHYLGAEFWKLTPFLLMIVILLFRPEGLFGTKAVRRV